MDFSTFLAQWKALVRRNYLLKKRNYYQLITVLILPITATFYILHQSNQPYIKSSAKIGVEYELPLTYADQDLIGIANTFHLCIAPRSIKEEFLSSIQESLSSYGLKRFVRVTKYENEEELNEGLSKKHLHNESNCDAGIIFDGNISYSGSYTVRVPDDGCSPVLAQYCSYGILSNIQQAVDNSYLKEWTGNANFKLPPTKIRGLIDVYEAPRNVMYRIVKFLLVIMYFPIITVITENIIHEKNMKIKESMLLMGMKPISYWFAWLFCEIVLILIVMLPIPISLTIANILPIKDILLHFLLWFGLGCSLVIFTMTITRFCTKAMVANIVVSIVLLSAVASDILGSNQNTEDMELTEYLPMFVSPVAYEKGFNEIVIKHNYGRALPVILIIFADLILYSVIDIILEQLFPYGITIPWEKLKFGGKNSEPEKTDDVHENEAFIDSLPSSPNLEPCIKLEKIRKSFSSCSEPKITVLDGVTLSVFKGEVTCLLGPNGAGKSTLMKIISKTAAPDEGKITTTSLQLGVCPQENILHDDLNIYEHLQFFGSLKGIPDTELDSKVTALLESFDLLEKKDTNSKVLSGGQKRKLCVVIAMIGDPEVLLLDEPSSGMSPHSRRQLWNMLQKCTKSGQSVLFTTHYMDEAELLSDRIALLNYGKLKYYGTTMDMKKQFGGGYRVRITLQSEPSLYIKSELINLISELPSKPKVILSSDSEVDVKLHSFDASSCAEFFKTIEDNFNAIGSECFTISVSALEEIFSFLAEEIDEQTSQENNSTSQNATDIPTSQSCAAAYRNINELIRCRLRLMFRSSYALLAIILPVLLMSWNRLLTNSAREITDIGPDLYKKEIIHVVNATGIPLTDFEKSLSKLDVKFQSVNKADRYSEKNFMKTEIRNYRLIYDRLDVNWNWTVSLSNSYALPGWQNLLSNVLWKTMNDDVGRELKISVQPLSTIEQNFSFFQSKTFIALMQSSLCMMFVALILGLEVVKEKEIKVIWLISTTRNNAVSYWISTFLVHLALFFISFCVIEAMLLFFGTYTLQVFSVFLAYNLCLPGCILTVYLLGQCFKSYKSADIGLTFMIICGTTALFIALLIGVVKNVAYIDILNIVALFVFPIYSPFGLIILLSQGETENAVAESTKWQIVYAVIIPLSWLLYALLIIFLEKWKTYKRKGKIQVMKQEAWNEAHNSKSTVVLNSVRKEYTKNRCSRNKEQTAAIRDLSMSFLEGEIFALMGSNGAGKSTLMKLLSLNVELTSGEIFFRDKYMEFVTYCAEENTIWPNLTVEEHVRLFAILNEVPLHQATRVMKSLALESHAKKRARHLSGGYQRKLSIALSLIGNSKLVLLDEPTTGMDPISKQLLWKKLHQDFPATSDRTLVLTTHSSNEAEVNCSRIGLFIDGHLRCLGTSQALKKEFSTGFELTVKLKNGDHEKFNNFLSSEIPEAVQKSRRGITLHYCIPKQTFQVMSDLFVAVGKIQKYDGVEDCFITECSLDQIILDLLDNTPVSPTTREDECSV